MYKFVSQKKKSFYNFEKNSFYEFDSQEKAVQAFTPGLGAGVRTPQLRRRPLRGTDEEVRQGACRGSALRGPVPGPRRSVPN